ncbi:beta-ketoacyl-[acyl-carrier-protein] synthase family protein [Bacillus sp. 166amftsu]|uniref:beta-ketoacyl-[acyl-carrier-protein] synthase family protein n=1 Tax=Bacillus sp. 166amftsu TaxID=1761753 RepID=UPI000896CDA3|nr:beta-ketoacyl-[acyl-carrier-protein] synthase family protein [Bacillus sp. 166amftsu]SDZ40566.1 3-oxoacyl-[acyl-carrier-protein] synthase II [Bacillus sp. 166amftsu]
MRVLVTGISTINSIATNVNQFWDNLLLGKSGIKSFTKYNIKTNYAVINEFDCYKTPGQNAFGRATSLLVTGIEDAIYSSGIDLENMNRSRIGISIGTTMGELGKHEDIVFGNVRGDRVDKPYALTDNISSYLGINGPIWTITNACAAGNYAIAIAYEEIQNGRADVMIAGGVDAFSLTAYAGFKSLRALTPDLCRPFDHNRKGLALGEGVGILILESENHFNQRGGKNALASVAGFGLTSDAYHVTKPDPKARGAIEAMSIAMKMAGLGPQDIKYVNSHGTGTPSNDYMEAIALQHVFGQGIKTSSIKANIGHTLGAASAIEAITCILALKEKKLPPTINLLQKDPIITADVITEVNEFSGEYIMSNSYAFGGMNSSLVLEKV